MTQELNAVQKVIREMGGFRKFATAIGHKKSDHLRYIAAGLQVPKPALREKIVRASGGRLTHEDIIALRGTDVAPTKPKGPNVDSHWDLPDDELRQWIASRAAAAARRQRLANERAR